MWMGMGVRGLMTFTTKSPLSFGVRGPKYPKIIDLINGGFLIYTLNAYT
jgi:hypothetical protein